MKIGDKVRVVSNELFHNWNGTIIDVDDVDSPMFATVSFILNKHQLVG